MFVLSARWKEVHPDARVATMVIRNVQNTKDAPALEARKRALEQELHATLGKREPAELKALPPIQAYTNYYKRFKKTYPVLQQLKTVAYKQQSLPTISGLVDAMFMAEIKNLLLTAGHDLAKVAAPVTIDAATGDEQYIRLNGTEQTTKAQDMIMKDEKGVISSVLYGPDVRTGMTLKTRDVLYVVYAPSGIATESVRGHLEDIRDSVLLFSPGAAAEPVQLQAQA